MNNLASRLLPFLIIIFCACGAEEENPDLSDRHEVLARPPFKGMSDSLRAAPDDIALLLRRAMMLSQENLHPYATEDYARAWKLTGDEDVALMYVANLLLSEKTDEAIELLQQCAVRFPENTEFHRRLAEIYHQQGNLKQALEQYNQIVAKDAVNFEAWYDRGTILAKMKDTAGAIHSYENSFSILPINYSGMALAHLYVAQKDPRALEVCNILLASDSSGMQTEPIYMRGVYFAEMGMDDKAIKEFDECIRRDWKMVDAYIEKGIIYFERRNFQEAAKIFTMANTISQTDADAYYWLGRCHEASGEAMKALENYQRAYALDESFAEARAGIERLRQ